MTRAAVSVFVFGWYLMLLGAALLLFPNLVLSLLGIALTVEVWIRIVGVLVVAIGIYYVTAARGGCEPFFAATAWVRGLVFCALSTLVILRLADPAVLVVGAVDVAGAVWTLVALRGE